jgi:hypothetical protein
MIMNLLIGAVIGWMLLQTAEGAAFQPQSTSSDRPQVGQPEKEDISPNLRDMPPLPPREGPPCEMPLGRIPPPAEREKKALPCRPGPDGSSSSEDQDGSAQSGRGSATIPNSGTR